MEEKSEKPGINRKRVNRIKKVILFFLVLLFFVPTVLAGYLFIKVGEIESTLQEIREEMSTVVETTTETTEDLAKKDEDALQNLEKDTVESVKLLAGSEQAEEKKTENAAEKETAAEQDAASTEEASEELNIEPNGKTIYLTFDDGPSSNTDAILDILAEKNVKATFFVVVKDESQKEKLNRIKEEGHTLAIHSASHKYSTIYASLDSFKQDVETAHDLILSMTGVDTKFYRFPGGSSNTVSKVSINECINYLDENGYTYFDWNALNEDAEATYTSPEKLNENVLQYIHQNTGDSMVLLHDLDNHPETVEALPDLIDTLIKEGYTFAAIDENTKPVQHVTVEEAKEALAKQK